MTRILEKKPPADESQLPEHSGVCGLLKQCWDWAPDRRPLIDVCLENLREFVGPGGRFLF